MNFYIIIPAHNEEAFLAQTLQSLTTQTLLPKKIVVINDHSTDGTQLIIDRFSEKFPFITSITNTSEEKHQPGSKVIKAFYKGLELIDESYDILCKFDADLIFPNTYLERISEIFQNNSTCGLAGGFCYIEKDGEWVLENLTNKDHIRGALKAYRKQCFQDIGGLKESMGWDTVDELLAQYQGWEIKTDESLHVKHLKPTGATYSKTSKYKQGEAFKKMRYGFLLTLIATTKLAFKKRSLTFYFYTITGFLKAKNEFIVTKKEGKFIRKLRWRNIKKKLF
ncbi:glycosyltransferase family 2 protein [Aureisphaera sp. CAU 1614]|uniref:Glycosyltransferase family 2 protein n=1 Tax=Halomarinibacterium sedimenti TaxID=2857106 RepID=A0A9X1K0U5_9FLAO|nr:glycosyltransferase family A protein [Halomarinibacterium sedimenti]MBW2938776.1 glycosyltransferase family 2 protein [Halomarinibacterium sedimenti]